MQVYRLSNTYFLMDDQEESPSITKIRNEGNLIAMDDTKTSPVTTLFFQDGEMVDKLPDGLTLIGAITTNDPNEIAEALVGNKEVVGLDELHECRDEYGNTIMMIIASGVASSNANRFHKESSVTAIAKLISNGFDINAINKQGYTALMCAAKHNLQDVVEQLLTSGADYNIKSTHNETAINIAVESRNENAVAFIENKMVMDGVDNVDISNIAINKPTKLRKML